MIFYDADARDIALLAIRTPVPIRPVQLARADRRIYRGEDVFSIGCDKGSPPTIRRTQIKNKASYDGAIKYDIYGRPVDGRSGGGLFTVDGKFIGVCNAAVVDMDEGIYSALDTVYWQLETVNLRHLFDGNSSTIQIAANQPPGQQATRGSDMKPIRVQGRAVAGANFSGSSTPKATNVSWNREDQGSEVVIIVRSKVNPGQSETITISDPSPVLLNHLEKMKAAQVSDPKHEVAKVGKHFR